MNHESERDEEEKSSVPKVKKIHCNGEPVNPQVDTQNQLIIKVRLSSLNKINT